MRKVLLTCAVVAGLFVVGVIVSGVVISSYFKSKFPDADKIDDMRAELHRRFGDPDAYTPPLDGRLPADRIELFVALRDSLAGRRDRAGSTFAGFVRRARATESADGSRLEKLGHTLEMVRGGTDMAAGLVDYYSDLQRRLLDRGMGDGEYAYWYCLTSFAWLGWEPLADADLEASLEEIGLRQDIEDEYAEVIRLFHRQLRNARRGLEAEGTRSADQERMLALVTAELDPDRVEKTTPLGGELPADWAATLAPCRPRLEAALPTGPGAVFLDITAVSRNESRNFRFEWNDRRAHRRRN